LALYFSSFWYFEDRLKYTWWFFLCTVRSVQLTQFKFYAPFCTWNSCILWFFNPLLFLMYLNWDRVIFSCVLNRRWAWWVRRRFFSWNFWNLVLVFLFLCSCNIFTQNLWVNMGHIHIYNAVKGHLDKSSQALWYNCYRPISLSFGSHSFFIGAPAKI